MKKSYKLTLIIFIIFAFSVRLAAQDAYTLAYKFVKGKTYFYRVTTDIVNKQSVNWQESVSNISAKFKFRFETVNAGSSGFDMITSYDSLYTKTTNQEGVLENDYKDVVGKRSEVLYSAYGKKLHKKLIDQITTPIPADLEAMLEFTDRPVKIGEIWTVSILDTAVFAVNGTIITTTKNEFCITGKEIRNGAEYLKISFTSNAESKGSAETQGYAVVYDGKRTMQGTIYFNYAKGMIPLIEYHVDSSSNTSIPDAKQLYPVSMNGNVKIVLIE